MLLLWTSVIVYLCWSNKPYLIRPSTVVRQVDGVAIFDKDNGEVQGESLNPRVVS